MSSQLRVAIVLLWLVSIGGTLGFVYLEGYTLIEAFYMTVITVSTVGYGEVRPLTESGRLFTAVLILFGFGAVAFAGHAFVESIVVSTVSGSSVRKKMRKKIRALSSHTIICGFGRVGSAAAQDLAAAGSPFVVIEQDEERYDRVRSLGFLTLRGDATDESVLVDAGIRRASFVLATLPSDPCNVFIALTARELSPEVHIVARTESPSTQSRMIQAGANTVVSPSCMAGREIAGRVTRNAGTKTASPSEPRSTRTSETGGRRGGKKRHTVFVDDNAVIRRVYTRLLRRAGFVPHEAKDGEEACDLIEQMQPEIAVLDNELPILTGIEVAERVRKTSAPDAMRLILFTADERPETHERAIAAGVDVVVNKCEEAETLVESVRSQFEELDRIRTVDPDGAVRSIRDELLDQFDGDESLVVELTDAFCQHVPGLVADLEDAAAAGDSDWIGRAAQNLRGCLAHVAAESASEQAGQIEERARRGEIEDVDRSVVRLAAEIDRTLDQLRRA